MAMEYIPPRGLFENLLAKLSAAARKLLGIRRPRSEDIFERRLFIWPNELVIPELGYRSPYAAFNPGAVLRGRVVDVFPRLIIGYFWYTSVVGYFSVDVDNLLEGRVERPLRVRLVVYPSFREDLAGCEDPRADYDGSNYYILYTALEPYPNRFHAINAASRQALAELDQNLKVKRKFIVRLKVGDRYYTFEYWKDSALLGVAKRTWLLTRPTIERLEVSWKGLLDMEEGSIDYETLEPVLLPEAWELKTGWSTNAVRIGSNEYLVGWHGVGRDLYYRNGLAIVDSQGELLAVTQDYVLVPHVMPEMVGERPGVIFGCGLLVYKDTVIWIGGVADTAIGVYAAPLDKVMEKMKWLKG